MKLLDKQHKIESPRISYIYTRKVNVIRTEPNFSISHRCHKETLIYLLGITAQGIGSNGKQQSDHGSKIMG